MALDEMIRGYQIAKNRYVTFSNEEIEALETDDNRALHITEFVDLDQIDPVFLRKGLLPHEYRERLMDKIRAKSATAARKRAPAKRAPAKAAKAAPAKKRRAS